MIDAIEPLARDTRLFEYEVQGTLGQGGFGTTYLVLDLNLRKQFVIKEFTPRHLVCRGASGTLSVRTRSLVHAFADARAEFLQEARRLAMFSHQNIVGVRRYFEANNTAYFVMDYEAGVPLRSLIGGSGSVFEDREIAGLLVPLCQGLARLHDAGLIHRDIKPENIIIRPDGSPCLIDFGASTIYGPNMVGSQVVVATPAYAPIEQLSRDGKIGPWTDIYALSATAYEIVTGAPPVPSLFRAQGKRMPAAFEVGKGEFSTRLLVLIDQGLEMDYTARPASVHDFLNRLQFSSDTLLANVIGYTSGKAVQHFRNSARPNRSLFCDELVALLVCFPIVDLAWRIGEGTPTKDVFLRLLNLVSPYILDECMGILLGAGFSETRRPLTVEVVLSRVDEYSATYLIDRQDANWTYRLTCQQAAGNCLDAPSAQDLEGFIGLIRDVLDRARGRVKRELGKALATRE